MSRLVHFASSAFAASSLAILITWFALACNVALADESLSSPDDCTCSLSNNACSWDPVDLICIGGACRVSEDCTDCFCTKIIDELDCICQPAK